MPRPKGVQAQRHNGKIDELFGAKELTPYNEDERRFGELLHTRLDRLLSGIDNELPLLRKYHNDPNRMGVIPVTGGIKNKELRLHIIEGMVKSVITLLYDGSAGGPPIQTRDGGNRIVETQEFTTKFPHIVLTRTDAYDASTRRPLETLWSARRVQNQRDQIRINRGLDIAALGFEIIRVAASLL